MTNLEHTGNSHTHNMYELLVLWELIPGEDDDRPDHEIEHEVVKNEIAKFERIAEIMYADKDTVSQCTRTIGQISFLRLAMDSKDDEALREYIRENKWSDRISINKRIFDMIKNYSTLTKRAQKAEASSSGIDMNSISFAAMESQLNENRVANLKETIYTLIEDESTSVSPAYGGQLQLLFGKRTPPTNASDIVINTAIQQSAAKLRNKLSKLEDIPAEEYIQHGLRYLADVLGNDRKTIRTIDSLVQYELFQLSEDSTLTSETIQDVIERCIAAALETLYKE